MQKMQFNTDKIKYNTKCKWSKKAQTDSKHTH